MKVEKWISIADASLLLMESPRHTRRKVINNEYKYIHRYIEGKGRGGKQIEVLLSSLPEDAQLRYHKLSLCKEDDISSFTSDQQAAANSKYWVVELYQKMKKNMTVDEFMDYYNTEYGTEYSKDQLFRWQKRLKEIGMRGLIDTRGGHNAGNTSISDKVWDYYYSLFMTQEKKGSKLCYDLTKKKFGDIPSFQTFWRQTQKIPDYAIVKYREGENSLRNNLPFMERDKTTIQSNDIWVSDHHRFDIFTQDNSNLKICRNWLTVFADVRSSKIISYECRNADPNASIIKKCFKRGIEQHGVPKEVYFDNGKDYRSKSFSADFPFSITRQLGINMIYATPYHGQAKQVERFFRTLEERFGKMFPTYTGKDAKARPEQMQISNSKILKYAVTQEVFLEKLEEYIKEYNTTVSNGNNMEGMTPDECYFKNLSVKKEIQDLNALKLLCGSFVERTIQRNGIQMEGRWYANDLLHYHYKKKVMVNYDPDNMDVINVFDMKMRALCTAAARVRTPYRNVTEEDYRRAKKEKAHIRKILEEWKPKMEIDTLAIIARNQLNEKEVGMSEDTTIVKQILPNVSNECKELNISEETVPVGESLTERLSRKYEMERKLRESEVKEESFTSEWLRKHGGERANGF